MREPQTTMDRASQAPLSLPDDPATRDARSAELVALLDAWMKDEHAGEPDWDVDDVPPVRLRAP